MEKPCPIPGCEGTPATCELSKLGIGCCGEVVSVGGEPDLRRRLLEMGFCAGTPVEVVRRAPLGDPIEFRIRGYHLSLREEQAAKVSVTPSSPENAEKADSGEVDPDPTKG